jgi:hypothetical protein
MSAINLVSTSDTYTMAATLTCPPSDALTVQVTNAMVYYQLFIVHGSSPGIPGDSAVYDIEKILTPGFWNFDSTDFYGGRCTGIQFRSATPGTPAVVSASN